MHEDDYVETSDTEEREQIQASTNVYWKQVLHGDSTCNNLNTPPRKRINHAYESVLSKPHTPACAATPSRSQLAEIPTSPSPMCGSTPQSSSLAPTPVQSVPDSHCKIWEEVFDDGELSQDPLLLSAQTGTEDTSDVDIPEMSSSPVDSQPSSTLDPSTEGAHSFHVSSRRRYSILSQGQSIDPLYFFSSPPQSCNDLGSPMDQDQAATDLTHNSIIDTREVYLVSHCPLRPFPPSPLPSPSPSLNKTLPMVVSDATPSSAGSPLNPSGIDSQNAAIEPTNLTELDMIPDERRYPQRRRGANQLKPYTVEQFQYKQALSANPDAIVKFHSLTRGGRRRYSDAEGDNIWELREQDCAEDSENWEESRRKRAKISNGSRSKSPEIGTLTQDTGALVQYPAILQDLSSTDEEEAKELHALSKEARKVERERRSKERLNRKNKVKSVPLSARLFNGQSAQKTISRDLLSQSDLQDKSSSPSPPRSRTRPSAMPVLTSYTPMTWEGHTPPRKTFPNKEELAMAESQYDMDFDCLGSPAHSTAESSNSRTKIMLDRKSKKALERMMPKFLATRFIQGDDEVQRPRRQRSPAIDSDMVDTMLLPGQTRVRHPEKPREAGEIKGDSESSDDERSSVAESLLEDVSLRSRSGIRPRKHSSTHTIELTDTSDDSENSSSDNGLDDEEIQMFLDPDKRQSSGRLPAREESLIDWMLAKTRTVGVPRKPSARKQPSDGDKRPTKATSKYKLDIRTRGSRRFGTERQTTLNFRNFSDENSFPPRDDGIRPSHALALSTSGGFEDSDHSHGLDTDARVMRDYNVSRKRARGAKAKERRARAKTNGVYTFPSGDTRAVTGGRKTAMISVNLEDEDFHMALAPSPHVEPLHLAHVECSTRKSRSSMQLHLNEQVGQSHTDVSSTNHTIVQRIPKASGVRHDIHCDSVLPSGLSFGPDTFTGRNWLYELVGTVSSPADATVPVAFTFRGSELGPSTSVGKLWDSLKDLINQLFDLVCDLPELDGEPADKDLGIETHLLCKLLSWFLATCCIEDRNFILNAAQNQISQSLARLREMSSLDASLDRSILSICWLMVELSARLGHSVKESVSWLVHNLLEYGLLQTMVAVREDNILNGSTTAQYTAELWVRIFHLLDYYDQKNTKKPHIHSFWVVIMESVESAEVSKRSLESSEATWHTIFSLCALTQFSVHGMTTAKSRLPACWEFVGLALKTIRLTADPRIDRELSAPSLDKRDEYLSLITHRCFRLWNRWCWELEGASILFNQLVDIFRSRKFANLRHEAADYPEFMLKGDWNLLSSYRHGKTAFELFLKLMFHATCSDMTNANRAISPRAKKLLSLAIPVGSLPFSRNSVTHMQDLSMLFNRLSAVAIGIYLDPSTHLSRITHARTYVNFSDADWYTRLAVVRGMMYLGILMKKCNVPLDGIVEWTKEMADALADDFKAIPKTIDPADSDLLVRKNRLVVSIQCLLGAVRRIMEAHKRASQYPEPALLTSCSRILLNTSLTNVDTTAQEVLGLAGNLFSARAMTLPPPTRPPLVPVRVQESQESQDEYDGIDLDFDDPALRAALGDDIRLTLTDYKPKEEALRKAIDSTQLVWLCWRYLNKRVLEHLHMSSMDDHVKEIESWLDCWLGCADVHIRYGGKSWDYFLDLTSKSWGTRSDDCHHRRIHLALMLRILKLDPMTYHAYADRYMEVMVEALVSRQSEVESEFISLLLSIDGLRHPLLQGISCDLISADTDYQTNLPELRSEILKIFVANIARRLREEATGIVLHPEDDIKYLIRMLSTMRRICTEFEPESEPRRTYVHWCQDILEVINQHPEVRSQARLHFLIGWGRSLS